MLADEYLKRAKEMTHNNADAYDVGNAFGLTEAAADIRKLEDRIALLEMALRGVRDAYREDPTDRESIEEICYDALPDEHTPESENKDG